jgi:hypothetical protein
LFCLTATTLAEKKGQEKDFSLSENRWAVKWINKELSLFMEKGIIKKIIAKNNLFEVYIAEPWYELEFSEQGIFLRDLSRSREITGHSPFFKVKDYASNEVVAKVAKRAIDILYPGMGFIPYFFMQEEKPRNTFY